MSEKPNWVPLSEVIKCLQNIKDNPAWWCSNTSLKYIKLSIDTRDQHCTIRDRENNPVTLAYLRDRTSIKREDRFNP